MAIELKVSLPKQLQKQVDTAIRNWEKSENTRRLWARDATLWTDAEEDKGLGWLDIVKQQQTGVERLKELQREIREARFEAAVLLGMGGSSVCPEVFAMTFGRQKNFPQLRILDSTNPEQIKALREAIDPAKTIFIVSSQSGSTLEPNILKDYFFEETKRVVGEDHAGKHFIAITDPGSKLERVAKEANFRSVYPGNPAIGGCYSALSNFGFVAAAIAGLDLDKLLSSAREAVVAGTQDEVAQNPGAYLGLILGTAALHRRDKLTFVLSPEIRALGAWLEQLIAASTGKDGKGILPVDREHIAPPSHYGADRIFAYLKLEGTTDGDVDRQVDNLEQSGQPFIRVILDDPYRLAAQFFTWELATAVAGAVIGIDPFDQPDVEAVKLETRRLIEDFSDTGKLDSTEPFFVQNGASGDENGIELYARKKYAKLLKASAGEKPTLVSLIKTHLDQLQPGNYFAVLAYLEQSEANEEAIQFFRHQVRGAKKVATCVGFGPRFQHSTGQMFKGGPNTGVFLHITANHAVELQVPGAEYSFGIVSDAQAAGDLAILDERGRRIVRVHLGDDVKSGLKRLSQTIEAALNDD